MKRLRRALLSTDQALAHGLKPLMCSGWMVTMLGMTITIGLTVGCNLLFNGYITSLQQLDTTANRQFLSVAIAYD
ncbi:unnamed protein product, partial [Symbiodinium sp. KB8]